MTDPSGHRGPSGDADADHRRPRWVKVFALVAVALVLLFVASQVFGGGHGPGRHSGGAGERAPLAWRP